MAWEENSCICLNMQLIAILSRIGVNIKEIAGAVNEFDLNLRIVGAADSKTGTPKINRKLSIKRAKYIAKLLAKAGVPKEKMIGVSQGGINLYKPYTANRHTCVIVYKKD